VATQHDLADWNQLLFTQGWATLLAILQTTGERPPKRPSPDDGDGSNTERLAKRVGGVRLDWVSSGLILMDIGPIFPYESRMIVDEDFGGWASQLLGLVWFWRRNMHPRRQKDTGMRALHGAWAIRILSRHVNGHKALHNKFVLSDPHVNASSIAAPHLDRTYVQTEPNLLQL